LAEYGLFVVVVVDDVDDGRFKGNILSLPTLLCCGI
jgi:hypothetical protein